MNIKFITCPGPLKGAGPAESPTRGGSRSTEAGPPHPPPPCPPAGGPTSTPPPALTEDLPGRGDGPRDRLAAVGRARPRGVPLVAHQGRAPEQPVHRRP